MKLALYLPNFRDEVTVKELEDLTALAEDLDFDSVWTLDRIVVPEASDRAELQYPFGMMTDFPHGLPVISRGKWFQGMTLIPWLAAKTHEGPHRHEHHRHPVPRPRRARRGARHPGPPVERPAQRRRRLRLDARGVRRRRAPRTSSRGGTSTCARRSRSCRASGPTTCSSTTASSPTSSRAGSATSRCRSRTRRSTSAGSRTRSARRKRIAKYGLRAGSASRTRRRTSSAGSGEIERELDELGTRARSTTSTCAA